MPKQQKHPAKKPRPPAAQFQWTPEEREQVKAAADFRRLKPARYMYLLVMQQVEQDLADKAAGRRPSPLVARVSDATSSDAQGLADAAAALVDAMVAEAKKKLTP